MKKETSEKKSESAEALKSPIFNCRDRQSMSLGEVINDVVEYMVQAPQNRYRVIIGTDSPGSKRVEFITAIVVHRVGKGGRYWWHRSATYNMPSRKMRIISEVLQSLRIADLVAPALKNHQALVNHFQKLGVEYKLGIPLEIHVDVGENGATRDMIQEVVGMVKGNGFEAKIKPDSFCASVVADRHT
jgi:predicted RNase H-related nuclease YkuK (DUF458 family)